jgi:hypothetical protein
MNTRNDKKHRQWGKPRKTQNNWKGRIRQDVVINVIINHRVPKHREQQETPAVLRT